MTGIKTFLACFASLPDPRQQSKVLYPLPEVLLLLLSATLAGADDMVEICGWGEEKLPFLRQFHRYRHGIPSHDTLGALLAVLDPEAFNACFSAWVDSLRDDYGIENEREVVAIDGKTTRRSHNRRRGLAPLHLLSAWACRQRMVVGQQASDGKSNEATTIPLLLQRLALDGALVSIDAAGTTTRIARTVLDRGADYLLALKGNCSALLADTEALFADPALIFANSETEETSHGRREHRRHVVCHDAGWINPTRWESDSARFPGVQMLGMVESTVTRDGQTSRERRYYLCSTRLDPVTFGRAVRSHWGIENRLHWMLDVVFRDDLARLRSANAPKNMAVIKHIALNLIRAAKPTTSFKNRRKLAGWSDEYLLKLVKGDA